MLHGFVEHLEWEDSEGSAATEGESWHDLQNSVTSITIVVSISSVE